MYDGAGEWVADCRVPSIYSQEQVDVIARQIAEDHEEAKLANEYREKYKAYEQQNYVLHEDLDKATARISALAKLLGEAREYVEIHERDQRSRSARELLVSIDAALSALGGKGVGDGNG